MTSDPEMSMHLVKKTMHYVNCSLYKTTLTDCVVKFVPVRSSLTAPLPSQRRVARVRHQRYL